MSLENILTPITYEEACLEVSRFLMHYPRRHKDQDAVLIQDLSRYFESNQIGIGVVTIALEDIRNEYRENNPWIPQTGYIIKEVRGVESRMKKQHVRLSGFNLCFENEEVIEVDREWDDFSDDEKRNEIEFMKKLERKAAIAYAKVLGIEKEEIEKILE